jgi:hypothetical protein
MPELPDDPDLSQLRRQARELLRAAAAGQPDALSRIRAVSGPIMLATAQLAVARQYGYQSWAALKADLEGRRPAASASAAGPGPAHDDLPRVGSALPERWSFGGAAPMPTAIGVLEPEALIAAAGHAVLHACLTPADSPALVAPADRRRLDGRRRRAAHAQEAAARTRALAAWLSGLDVVDSTGRSYAVRPGTAAGRRGPVGEPRSPLFVQLRLEPAPGPETGWLEIRGRDGSATRLQRSSRPPVWRGEPAVLLAGPAERTLENQARWLIQLRLRDVGADILRRNCAGALAQAAEIQRSGELDPGGRLPDELRQLCAVLTEHGSAAGLRPAWSGMLAAAGRTDGPSRHLDIGAVLPALDGVTVHVDSLISARDCWRLYLRAVPRWFEHSEDGQRKWTPVSVLAEDDRGNGYLSEFGGSTGAEGHEELGLQFRPRLDPLARGLALTFRGAREQVAVNVSLDGTTASRPGSGDGS